jgi:hypothetical protein
MQVLIPLVFREEVVRMDIQGYYAPYWFKVKSRLFAQWKF